MSNSIVQKRRECRILVFLLFIFSMLSPIMAQNVKTDTLAFLPEKFQKKQDVLLKTQNQETMLQSVSTASGDKLLHRPTFQMENTFDGILPGLWISSSNGYSTSQSTITLRGRTALIVVDGVPRSDANIPASQIESISVIKDGVGLAAMGLSSGNGVVYIKTKKGKMQSMQIELTAQLAFKQQMNRPEFLGSYEYAKLLNEALTNDGLPLMYSDRDIELYKTGASPFTHPDVDWYDVLSRKTAPIQQYNLNIHGGGQVARYFVDMNVYDESGFFKQDGSVNTYDTQESFKKYSLRANADISLTPYTVLRANIFGQMFRETTPGTALIGTMYPSMHYTPNNAYPVFNPDGSFGGAPLYATNLYAQSIYSGYNLYPKTDFNIDVSLEHKFKGSLEGLSVSGIYSYNSSYRELLNRSKTSGNYYYWKDPNNPESEESYTRLSDNSPQSDESTYNRQNRMQYLQLSAGYDFSVGLNNVRTKVSYMYNDYFIQGTNLPLIKNGYTFTAEYDYDKKYLVEFAASAMGLNQLKPGERWGFFPSAGIGWNISKEDWFKEAVPAIDFMKLRMTYGINGSDGSGAFYRSGTGTLSNYYYTYLKHYKQTANGVYTGASPSGSNIYTEEALPYVSKWEKTKRLNIGVDIEAFNRTLSGTVEFFTNTYSDLFLGSLASNNNLMGVSVPNINKGKYRQTGLELNVDYNNKFGEVTVSASANATLYWTKRLADAGNYYPETYMERVGKPYSMTFGYVANGFFQSQSEIDEYLQTTKIADYNPIPGDIKYVDINKDGVLDGKDIKAIGTHAPRIEYGIFLGAEWKGLSLTTQWAGLANRDVIAKDMPFGINSKGAYGQALVEHLDRWTSQNPNARYPRVSAITNSYNERTSTFWLKNGDFLRLKNLEIGYTLPSQWTSPMRLSKVKVFANAYNLLTITGLKDRDPEIYNLMEGTVPNFKAINFGLNIQF